uniref:Decapping nuclease n=1 Tax=Rhabditophanes sp. KR3021 TaxID=114890 RepID=A0AC35TPI1_9BILA
MSSPRNGSYSYFSKPEVVAEISFDQNSTVIPGRTTAKYFNEACLKTGQKYDLMKGYEKWEPTGLKSKLDMRCNGILYLAKQKDTLKEGLFDADIFISRGLATKLAVSCYIDQEIDVIICKHHGVLFMIEFPDDFKEKKGKESFYCLDMRKEEYVGQNFETFITTRGDGCDTAGQEKLNSSEQFRVFCKSIVRSGNNDPEKDIKITYSCETDCIDKNGKYLEIKTSNASKGTNFIYAKALKTWTQCFMNDIDYIVVGLRNFTTNKIVNVTKINKSKFVPKYKLPTSGVFKNLHGILRKVIETFEDNTNCKFVHMTKKKSKEEPIIYEHFKDKFFDFEIFNQDLLEAFP